MKEQRASAQSAYGRVSFPVFTTEEARAVAEMNRFYEAMRDAVLTYAEQLNEQRREGLRTVAAEYMSACEGARITVTYTVTVRRRGRVIGRKLLTHTWEDGLLCPPPRRRLGIFKRWRKG